MQLDYKYYDTERKILMGLISFLEDVFDNTCDFVADMPDHIVNGVESVVDGFDNLLDWLTP